MRKPNGNWYPNLIGNPKLASHGPYHGTNQWFNEAAFAHPPWDLRQLRRNTLNGPGLIGRQLLPWQDVCDLGERSVCRSEPMRTMSSTIRASIFLTQLSPLLQLEPSRPAHRLSLPLQSAAVRCSSVAKSRSNKLPGWRISVIPISLTVVSSEVYGRGMRVLVLALLLAVDVAGSGVAQTGGGPATDQAAVHQQRAHQLLSEKKPELAAKEFAAVLAVDPQQS